PGGSKSCGNDTKNLHHLTVWLSMFRQRFTDAKRRCFFADYFNRLAFVDVFALGVRVIDFAINYDLAARSEHGMCNAGFTGHWSGEKSRSVSLRSVLGGGEGDFLKQIGLDKS